MEGLVGCPTKRIRCSPRHGICTGAMCRNPARGKAAGRDTIKAFRKQKRAQQSAARLCISKGRSTSVRGDREFQLDWRTWNKARRKSQNELRRVRRGCARRKVGVRGGRLSDGYTGRNRRQNRRDRGDGSRMQGVCVVVYEVKAKPGCL